MKEEEEEDGSEEVEEEDNDIEETEEYEEEEDEETAGYPPQLEIVRVPEQQASKCADSVLLYAHLRLLCNRTFDLCKEYLTVFKSGFGCGFYPRVSHYGEKLEVKNSGGTEYEGALLIVLHLFACVCVFLVILYFKIKNPDLKENYK
jgi:hypothetical protein